MLSSSTIALPLTPVLITGEVNVLLVNVCEPVNVVTVESMFIVTPLPLPTESIPVPPKIDRVSESKSMLSAPPESAMKSRSCAVTCAST